MKRILAAVSAGTVVLFAVGFLLYVVILGGFYEANLGSATGVVREVPVPWAMILAHVALASLLTFVLLHAGAATAGAGLRTGSAFGLLFGVAIAFDLYAVTHWSNVNVAFVEPFVTGLRITLGSAAIAWVLGKLDENRTE